MISDYPTHETQRSGRVLAHNPGGWPFSPPALLLVPSGAPNVMIVTVGRASEIIL
jgi:hypothetical protein